MSAGGTVFDLDGVLVDSEPLWEAVLRRLLAEHGATYDHGVAQSHMGMRPREVVAVILDAHGLALDPVAFAQRMIHDVAAAFDAGLEPMAGAAEALALAAARGPVAIASSSPLRVIERAVAACGWRLDAVCSGDEVPRGKPAPDVYLLAAERIGVASDLCVALEDSPHGVASARAAGMRCIGVGTPADVTLRTLADLEPRHLGA